MIIKFDTTSLLLFIIMTIIIIIFERRMFLILIYLFIHFYSLTWIEELVERY